METSLEIFNKEREQIPFTKYQEAIVLLCMEEYLFQYKQAQYNQIFTINKSKLRKIFEAGANALYNTIDQNTGECANKEEYERIFNELVIKYVGKEL